MKRLALGLALVASILLLAAFVASKAPPHRWNTDVLALLPGVADEPRLAELKRLLGDRDARIVWIACRIVDGQEEAVAASIRQLGSSPPFVRSGSLDLRDTISVVAKHRLPLLLPRWLEDQSRAGLSMDPESIARRAVATTEARLAGPDGWLWGELLDQDFLMLGARAADWRTDLFSDEPGPWSVFWAELEQSPLSEGVGESVGGILEELRETLEREGRIEDWQDNGVWKFATASRARIRAEVGRLNLMSTLGVLVLTAIALRRPWRVLLLAPIPFAALLAGLAAVTAAWGEIHVILMVLGALLVGVAIDYGFHLCVSPSGETDAHLARKIALASGSTAVGFGILLFAPLPILRQLGLLVLAGLLASVAFAWAMKMIVPPSPDGFRALMARPWIPAPARRVARVVFVLVVLVGTLWVPSLSWQDDLRELDLPDPQVLAAHARWTETIGAGGTGTRGWITHAPTLLEALGRQDQLRLAGTGQQGDHAPRGASRLLPTPASLAALRAWLEVHGESFPQALARALEEAGYEAIIAERFSRQWQAALPELGDPERVEALLREVAGSLPLPLSSLLGVDAEGGVVLAVPPRGLEGAVLAAPGEGTREIGGSRLLDEAFSRFREEISRLLLIGALVALAGLALVLGPREATRLSWPVLAASAAILGFHGASGPANLFHVLGLLLGICLALDYGVFTPAGQPPPATVRLAALTSACAFGVLATSAVPAVAALGSTVAGIVLLALLELESRPLAGRST